MKILLADDDQDQLELRSLLFSQNGFETIAVTTVAAALHEAKEHRPQCAVIDLKIPAESDGLDLIRGLKAFDVGIRVFVLTGGNAKRINGLPEMTLVEEVMLKGTPIATLLKKLREFESSGGEVRLAALRVQLAKDGVVTFDVKAVPRAAHSGIVGITTDGAVKVRVAAVPDKGKANEELRDVLAAWFQVPKNNVHLLHGETSPRKVWRVRK